MSPVLVGRIQEVKDAIDRIFGDRSLDPVDTIDAMDEISDHAETNANALREEVEE